MEILNGIFTAILLILFIGIWIWAWSSRNKEKFERMSALPLEDEQFDDLEVNNE